MKKPLTKREKQAAHNAWAAAFGKEPIDVGARAKREPSANPKPKLGRGSEHAEQCAVIAWWFYTGHKRYNAHINDLFAIPNGGDRNMLVAVKLKAEGVRAGVLDLFLTIPCGNHHGLFIEMKYDKNKPTVEQKEFITRAEARGYATAVCWTAEEAVKVIEGYLNVELRGAERDGEAGMRSVPLERRVGGESQSPQHGEKG